MSDREWVAGESGVVSLTVANQAGTLTDPTVLRLKVKPPNAAVVTYTYGTAPELVRDGVGLYHANLIFAVAGIHSWRWESDVPNGIIEESLTVGRSSVVV